MRISTRIKLINNQIKALKNKKRILVESITPMAPKPPRTNSEDPRWAAADRIYRWSRKSGTNKLALELYLFMSDYAQSYIPGILEDHYDSGQFDDVYDDIWDIITYSSSETWEKLEVQMGPEAAFDKVIELVFKGFNEIQNWGDTFIRRNIEENEDELREDFWEDVATILRRMWDEG